MFNNLLIQNPSAISRMTHEQQLEDFDHRLYALEDAQDVAEQIDRFIWANPTSFFR